MSFARPALYLELKDKSPSSARTPSRVGSKDGNYYKLFRTIPLASTQLIDTPVLQTAHPSPGVHIPGAQTARPASASPTTRQDHWNSYNQLKTYNHEALQIQHERELVENDKRRIFNRVQHLKSQEERALRQLEQLQAQVEKLKKARENHDNMMAHRRSVQDRNNHEKAIKIATQRAETQARKIAYRQFQQQSISAKKHEKQRMKELLQHMLDQRRLQEEEKLQLYTRQREEALLIAREKATLRRSFLLSPTTPTTPNTPISLGQQQSHMLLSSQQKQLKIQLEKQKKHQLEVDISLLQLQEQEQLIRVQNIAERQKMMLEQLEQFVALPSSPSKKQFKIDSTTIHTPRQLMFEEEDDVEQQQSPLGRVPPQIHTQSHSNHIITTIPFTQQTHHHHHHHHHQQQQQQQQQHIGHHAHNEESKEDFEEDNMQVGHLQTNHTSSATSFTLSSPASPFPVHLSAHPHHRSNTTLEGEDLSLPSSFSSSTASSAALTPHPPASPSTTSLHQHQHQTSARKLRPSSAHPSARIPQPATTTAAATNATSASSSSTTPSYFPASMSAGSGPQQNIFQ